MRITFVLLATLSLYATNPAKAQMSFEDSTLTYLKENAKDFQKNRGHLVDDDIAANNQIFFIQENHAIKENCAVELALIEELKAKTDFTYYLAEMDLGEAAELNEYLKTGNEEILKKRFARFKGTLGWMKENYSFYLDLYRLNQKSEKKIQFLGADIVQNPFDGLDYLRELLGKSEHTKTIVDTINGGLNRNSNIFALCHRIAPAIESVLLTDTTLDAFTIHYHLNNISNLELAWSFPEFEWDRIRDSLIFENYQKLVSHYGIQNEKMVGVWGRDHGFQEEHSNTKWFASSLKQNLRLSIYTYSIFYLDCQQRFPRAFLPGILKPFYGWGKRYNRIGICNDDNKLTGLKPSIELLKKASMSHTITLFRLDKPLSPLTKTVDPDHRYIPFVANAPAGCKLVTTDFFQTAILIRNSKAALPLVE